MMNQPGDNQPRNDGVQDGVSPAAGVPHPPIAGPVSGSSQTKSDGDSQGTQASREKLGLLVAQLEARIDKQKEEKQRLEEVATRREGIYLLVFHMALVTLFSGLHGIFLLQARTRNLPRAPGDFLGDRLFDAQRFWVGLQAQVPQWYWLDLGMVAVGIGLAFGIKHSRRRRRYFMLAGLLVVGVYSALIMQQMSETLRTLA